MAGDSAHASSRLTQLKGQDVTSSTDETNTNAYNQLDQRERDPARIDIEQDIDILGGRLEGLMKTNESASNLLQGDKVEEGSQADEHSCLLQRSLS